MPNHVTNILEITGEASLIKQCLKNISSVRKEKGGDSYKMLIDFDKVIPRPKSLDITSGTSVNNAVALIRNDDEHFRKMLGYPWVITEGLTTVKQLKDYFRKSLSKKDLQEGRLAIQNEKIYGCQDWYTWSCKFWGTKWNAYEQSKLDFGKIQFDTAWSTPFPVILELSKQYPFLSFEVKFADEDLGNNCGSYTFREGELVEEYQPEDSEALKFACLIKGYDYNDFVLDNFEYWDIDTASENSKTLGQLLQDGYGSELFSRLDLESEDGRKKAELLKDVSVRLELYEEAGILAKMLNG